jgi:hypothetical protein
MKKFLVIGLLVVGGLWVCKKTHLCSYASTLWNKGRQAVKGEIPRQFELDRIQNEIDKLDNDVRVMLGPIAEKQAALNRMQRDIEAKRVTHKDLRSAVLDLTQKVEAGGQVSWDGDTLSPREARARLARLFARFKAVDKNLKIREQVLTAQKRAIQLAKEQLSKIAEQKSLFEARLAQLRANEEHLNLESIATPLRFDEGRVADIKNTLDAVEQGQEVEREKRTLETQYGSRPRTADEPECCPAVNTHEVRNFLGATTTNEKVANNK